MEEVEDVLLRVLLVVLGLMVLAGIASVFAWVMEDWKDNLKFLAKVVVMITCTELIPYGLWSDVGKPAPLFEWMAGTTFIGLLWLALGAVFWSIGWLREDREDPKDIQIDALRKELNELLTSA
jgi:hypothetical protein